MAPARRRSSTATRPEAKPAPRKKSIRGRTLYSKTMHVASFAGIAPVNNPVISVAVIIDTPKGASYYGAAVSAPVFAEVAQQVLEYLGVPHDVDIREPKPAAEACQACARRRPGQRTGYQRPVCRGQRSAGGRSAARACTAARRAAGTGGYRRQPGTGKSNDRRSQSRSQSGAGPAHPLLLRWW